MKDNEIYILLSFFLFYYICFLF